MNQDINERIDVICGVFDGFPVPEGAKPHSGKSSEIVRTELGKYMLYLALSDGMLTDGEITEIAEIMKTEDAKNPEWLLQYTKFWNIFSVAFETAVPETFKLTILMDNYLIGKGCIDSARLSATLLGIYNDIGVELLRMNGEPTKGEKFNFITYMKTLEDYRTKNFGKKDIDEADIPNSDVDKNDDQLNDSQRNSQVKDSVKAPKKS